MRNGHSSRVKRAIKLLLIVVAIAVEVFALSMSGAGGDRRVEARSQAAAPKGAHQKPTRKLSSRLQILAQPATRAASAAAQADQVSLPDTGPGSLTRDAHGQLLVYIRVADVSNGTRQALQAAGATIKHVSSPYRTITALADAGQLPNLEALPQVQYVEEVLAPYHATASMQELARGTDAAGPRATVCNPIVSEGDAQLNANTARSSFGVDGSGVTVGILSDTYDQYASAHTHAADDILSGDLPGSGNPCGRVAAVNVISTSLSSSGVYDEGRAMAQIVHDLAPGANLAFASAWNGLFQFADNIRNLRTVAGSDVIADDVSYYAEPFFQDGPVAAAISDVVATGALYFTAAGNDNVTLGGQVVSSYETPAYRPVTCPTMSSGGSPLVPGVDIGLTCHNFSTSGTDNTSSVTLGGGQSLVVDLQWAEPWYGVTTDVDVFLVDQNNHRVLAKSIADSPGSGQPFEFFSYTNTGGASRTVDIVINRWNDSGTPRLKYIFVQPSNPTSVEYGTSSGGDIVGPSIFGHAGAGSAISMAAVPYYDSTSPEPYTSHGPSTYYFGPVVGTSPASPLPSPDILQKPDVAATDGGANTFFGGLYGGTYRFYGTSAAAPHAAAVAALMKQHANGRGVPLDQTVTRSILSSTARAVANGTQVSVGAGLVDAYAANQQVQALSPPDTTAPIITPIITGTVGNNGWYTSAMTVTWTVSDPESGIASSSGCDPTTLAADTAGTTLTCAATNGVGLSNSSSLTIKLDQTPPAISGAPTTSPNAAGWFTGTVTVHWTCGDALSGLAGPCPPDSTITTDGAGQSVSASVSDLAGNTSTATVGGINIDRAARPDLIVTAVTAPATGRPGQTVPITWTVTNQGHDDALPTWQDRAYLSTDTIWNSGDFFLTMITRTVTLPAGSSYTMTANVTLSWMPAAYNLLLRTDMWNQVAESDETNNQQAVPITVGLPDLAPTVFVTPAAGRPWQVVPITWTVTNQGLLDASPSWEDRVYVSADATWDSGDTFLIKITHSAPVLAGGSYAQNASVTLPGMGTYYLILRTDMWNQVKESNETNNQQVVPITIGLPDLTPTAFITPTTGRPWQVVPITWTIKNQGPVDAAPTWEDRVYLSADATWNSGDIFLTKITQTTTVPAGGSYTLGANVALPGTGTYYLILRSDMWNQLRESDETNNAQAVPITIGLPDLTPTAFATPATGTPWQVVPITWTVKNQGPLDAVPTWEDRAYFSADATWDSGDIFLTKITQTATVPAGGSYTLTANVVLPAMLGTHYLILRTDMWNQVKESDETDNQQVVAVVISP